MEPKNKLLATASSQAQGACADSIKDTFRFSDLPEGVAHHILSFLAITDLTRFGCVSNRCRELYLSTPFLNFYDFPPRCKSSCNKHFKLLSALDRFLVLRRDSKIRRFRICWSFAYGKTASLYDEPFRVFTWIHTAVRCNVEELDLDFSTVIPDTMMQELPHCIFHCGSLRSLSVHSNNILIKPFFTCSTNLQSLKLRDVKLDEGFCKWISSSCKCIKELKIENVEIEKITIESLSLESFSFAFPSNSDRCHLNISGEKLENLHIESWIFDAPGSNSLNIFAPNIKYLKWNGYLLNHQNLGKLTCLEKAVIFLKHKENDNGSDDVFEILSSISRVKVLILTDETAKVLLRRGFMPAPFDNISCLGMQIESSKDDGTVPAMVSLLRGMPNLNALFIQSVFDHSLPIDNPLACRFNREYWKSQNLAFISNLKDVTIELSNGNNELELARYMLEDAKNLKKMIILYEPQQSTLIKVVNESKVNSTATVIFQEKQSK